MITTVMRIELANKNRDKIVVHREVARGRQIFKAELYGGTEENRFGSMNLRARFLTGELARTYENPIILLHEIDNLIHSEKLKVAGIEVFGFKGTPFPYYFKEPGRKVFTKRYLNRVVSVAETIIGKRIDSVSIFTSNGKLIVMEARGKRARFFAPLLKDEFEVELPSPKLARAVKEFVKKQKGDIDYVINQRGLYRVVQTQKKAFLDSLTTIAFNKKLWKVD